MSKLKIQAKCSDLFFAEYVDDDGLTVTHDGYVPSGLGIGDFGGDYVEMTIDTKTGQIEGWKPLKKFQVLRAFQDA
jgi:hypothetical protein